MIRMMGDTRMATIGPGSRELPTRALLLVVLSKFDMAITVTGLYERAPTARQASVMLW